MSDVLFSEEYSRENIETNIASDRLNASEHITLSVFVNTVVPMAFISASDIPQGAACAQNIMNCADPSASHA